MSADKYWYHKNTIFIPHGQRGVLRTETIINNNILCDYIKNDHNYYIYSSQKSSPTTTHIQPLGLMKIILLF